MIKRIDNKCPHYDEHWGCAISPIKKCDTCPSAIWYYVTDDKTKPKDMEKMDYENKYKEALERAKKLQETCDSPAIVGWMEYIFHELKESEDERIRKELLEHCKNQAKPYIQTGNKCPQIQSWITWLEKQCQKTQQTPQWMIDFLNENRGKFASLMGDYDEQREAEGKLLAIIDWLGKQGEEKKENIVIDEGKEEMDYCFTKMMLGEQILEEQGEEKLVEWNSDDEQYLLICKNALAKYQVSDKWDADIISRWLENKVKSLPTQPKQEWSKEDEKIKDVTIAFLEEFKQKGYENAVMCIDWLKSLCSQPKQEWNEEDAVMATAAESFIRGEKEDFACNGIHREDVLAWFNNKILKKL